ncbi:hypothetical protein ACFRMN_18455 [Streptomyces sp. NPDC056835]|uniref:hypothetical protein n=1 Tax=Streptomyces sp. NPDC056835 TaxID=3345956 RepID=UPI0036761C73
MKTKGFRSRAGLALLTITAAGTLVGCSADSSESNTGPGPTNTAASPSIRADAACDGSLRGAGVSALEQISGADEFQPGPDTNQPIKQLADALVTDLKKYPDKRGPERMLCSVSPQESDPSARALYIFFQWGLDTPSVGGKPTHSTFDMTYFDIAKFAMSADNSTYLGFACPSASGQDSRNRRINAEAGTWGLNAETRSAKREAQVRILHSASVALAKQLGCFKESGLPETLGELTPLPLEK